MNTTNKRGRPADPNKTKVLVLDADTKKPCGRGRPQAGRKLIKVTVQQNFNAADFDWNTSKYSNPQEYTVDGVRKIKNKVNVTIIPAENLPEAKPEAVLV